MDLEAMAGAVAGEADSAGPGTVAGADAASSAGDAGGADAAGRERSSGAASDGDGTSGERPTGGDGDRAEPAAVKTVPHAALHEAREQVKALKAQIAQIEAQPKLSAEDAALLQELRAAKQRKTEEAEPDFLADPKAYVDGGLKKVLKELEESKKETAETRKALSEREQIEHVYRTTLAAEQAFVAQQPDYPHALEHIRQVRETQLSMQFPDATQEQIRNHIAFEERETARALLQQNRNPADFAYRFAATLGYKVPDKPAQPAKKADKDAVRTLGSGGGDAPAVDTGDEGGMPEEFGQALAERFKRKRG